jgi:hypothetical protein
MKCSNSTTCPNLSVCYLNNNNNNNNEGSCECLTLWAFSGIQCNQETTYTIIQRTWALFYIVCIVGFLFIGFIELFLAGKKGMVWIKNIHALILSITLGTCISLLTALSLDAYGSMNYYLTIFSNSNTKPIGMWLDFLYVEGIFATITVFGNIITALFVASAWVRIALDAKHLTRHATHSSSTRQVRLRVAVIVLSIFIIVSSITLFVQVGFHAGFIAIAIFGSIAIVLFIIANILISSVVKSSTSMMNSGTIVASPNTETSIFSRYSRQSMQDKLLKKVLKRIQITSILAGMGMVLIVLGASLFQRVEIPGFDPSQDLSNRPTVIAFYVLYSGEFITCAGFCWYASINIHSIRKGKHARDVERATIRMSSKMSKEMISKLSKE